MTFSDLWPHFKSKSHIVNLKDKVTIAQYMETIPNIWNGNMFGDLDLPLNASRGLSAIAEFLVTLETLFINTEIADRITIQEF